MQKYNEWIDIKGYEGIYQINIKGEIKSLERLVSNGNGFRKEKERLLKPKDNGFGYLRVCLSNNGVKKFTLIHKLIAEYFIPNTKNLKLVNHKDGNKQNNSIENLEWVTSSENNQHAYDIGLKVKPKGERASRAKLKLTQVNEIRELLKNGSLNQKQIAVLYGVNSRTINGINKNKTWVNQ